MLSVNVSTAWLVCIGVGLRQFGKVIKNRSMRPCPWSNINTSQLANRTGVAPRMQKGVLLEISRVFSVTHL